MGLRGTKTNAQPTLLTVGFVIEAVKSQTIVEGNRARRMVATVEMAQAKTGRTIMTGMRYSDDNARLMIDYFGFSQLGVTSPCRATHHLCHHIIVLDFRWRVCRRWYPIIWRRTMLGAPL
jgi:hypothetical protein